MSISDPVPIAFHSKALGIASSSDASTSAMGRAPRQGRISVSMWRGLLPSGQCVSHRHATLWKEFSAATFPALRSVVGSMPVTGL